MNEKNVNTNTDTELPKDIWFGALTLEGRSGIPTLEIRCDGR